MAKVTHAITESLRNKSLFASIPAPAPVEGAPFNIKMGPKEVIHLKGLHFWWAGVGVAGTNSLILGLWRKTDSDPPTSILTTESDDLVWAEQGQFQMGVALESVWTSDHGHADFPDPGLLLIRAPRLMFRAIGMTGVVLSVRLYYVIHEVSAADMSAMMLKDHA